MSYFLYIRKQLYSFWCEHPVFPTPFINETIFSLLFVFVATLSRLTDHTYEGAFVGSLFYPLVHMILLMKVPYYIYYSNFIVYFEMWQCDISSFLKLIILLIYFCLFWVFIAPWAFSLLAESRGSSQVVVHDLLIVVASLIAEHRLQSPQASVVVAHRFRFFAHICWDALLKLTLDNSTLINSLSCLTNKWATSNLIVASRLFLFFWNNSAVMRYSV